jgi:hypothetical protein
MKHLELFFTTVILFSITILAAHPPSAVNGTLDREKGLLTVNFNHQVKNNADHFVGDVVVTRNKKEVVHQQLTFQDSNDGGTLIFKINDLKPKDKLEIVATCNKIGKKNSTLEIK